jgi:hypothetical protein
MRLGLVDHLVPADRFAARVDELVRVYLAAPQTASIASKRLMRRASDAPFETVYGESLPLLAQCHAHPTSRAPGGHGDSGPPGVKGRSTACSSCARNMALVARPVRLTQDPLEHLAGRGVG